MLNRRSNDPSYKYSMSVWIVCGGLNITNSYPYHGQYQRRIQNPITNPINVI